MKEKLSHKLFIFSIIACAAILIAAISYFRVFDNYELGLLDLRFHTRFIKPLVSDKIVVIEIGEDSIEKLGRFPFDRSYHAIMVNALSEFGARMVGFDLLFSEPGAHDDELKDAIKKAGNVYLPFVFNLNGKKAGDVLSADGYLVRSLDIFTPFLKGAGHINIVPDIDGKYRRIPIHIKYNGALYPYMSFLMGCDYLGTSPQEINIPLDDNSMSLVNFSGKWGAVFKHYSYVDVLKAYSDHLTGQKPVIDPAVFKDKICIIGLTASGTSDIHPNPLEILYPGVGMHAELLNSMLNKRFLVRFSREINLVVLAIFCALISLITFILKPIKGLTALISAILILLVIAILLFNFLCIWMDVAWPLASAVLLYIALTLYKYISEWKRRILIENELTIAKKIQESFLPKKLPEISGIDISCSMFTARQVGGDLYDFCEFSPDLFGVMIGDVSGKGVPASLFMAMVIGAFRSFAKPGESPEGVLINLNKKILNESSSNLFVTAFYAIFDLKEKEIIYSNGAHLPVMHLTPAGAITLMDCDEGMPLGLMEGPYLKKTVKFEPGDIFVFYTDGITEAMDASSELYGAERLEAVVKASKGISAKSILSAIEKDVRMFEPKSKQHDDMTLIVIKV